MAEVCDRVGLGETCIRSMMERGDFPRPFRIGQRAVAFLETDVDRWIADRAAKRVMFTAGGK
jgi:prophage regulatory protein